MSRLVLSSFLELKMRLSREVLPGPPENFPRSTRRLFSPGLSLLFLFFVEVLSLNENNYLAI
ncbi:hypothetical protein KSP40_PGU001683 [Platanthera guangdongensis]|uniref:Uncharacterized protein n=1 Tax=Platanthera guangdongensis TaxID=2320717 RepID=A0ABR2M1D3_9ASPA